MSSNTRFFMPSLTLGLSEEFHATSLAGGLKRLVLQEFPCTEEGCTAVYWDRYKLSYHLRNQHAHLIQPQWMQEKEQPETEEGVEEQPKEEDNLDNGRDLNCSTDSDMSGVQPLTKLEDRKQVAEPEPLILNPTLVEGGIPVPKLSPESNKENQNQNLATGSGPLVFESKKSSLQEKTEKKNLSAAKSRGAMILHLSR